MKNKANILLLIVLIVFSFSACKYAAENTETFTNQTGTIDKTTESVTSTAETEIITETTGCTNAEEIKITKTTEYKAGWYENSFEDIKNKQNDIYTAAGNNYIEFEYPYCFERGNNQEGHPVLKVFNVETWQEAPVTTERSNKGEFPFGVYLTEFITVSPHKDGQTEEEALEESKNYIKSQIGKWKFDPKYIIYNMQSENNTIYKYDISKNTTNVLFKVPDEYGKVILGDFSFENKKGDLVFHCDNRTTGFYSASTGQVKYFEDREAIMLTDSCILFVITPDGFSQEYGDIPMSEEELYYIESGETFSLGKLAENGSIYYFYCLKSPSDRYLVQMCDYIEGERHLTKFVLVDTLEENPSMSELVIETKNLFLKTLAFMDDNEHFLIWSEGKSVMRMSVSELQNPN